MRRAARTAVAAFVAELRHRRGSSFYITATFLQPVIVSIVTVGACVWAGNREMVPFAAVGAGFIGIWNAALWGSGTIIDEERRAGTLPLLLAAPADLRLVLLGKSLADASPSVLALPLSFATASLIGADVAVRQPVAFALAVVATLLSTAVLGVALSAAFVLSRTGSEYVPVVNYPIFLLAGLAVPVAVLPAPVRFLSSVLSVRWGNEAATSAVASATFTAWTPYLLMFALTVVYTLLAATLHEIVERRARWEGSLGQW
jgi:ABC-2 type transport system permease protein